MQGIWFHSGVREYRGDAPVNAVTDNRDLKNRREKLGLSQQDVADLLCGFDQGTGRGFHFSNVSRFETGVRDLMPPRARGERPIARADYENLLASLEASAA